MKATEHLKKIRDFFITLWTWITIPLLTVFFTIATISTVARSTLQDDLLLRWDWFLMGTSPFLALGNMQYPGWLASGVVLSYSYLVVTVILGEFYLFYKSRFYFREFAAAFALSVVIMAPGWLFLPALAPQGRFIDNNYNLPVPAAMASQLEQYHPQSEIRSFLQTVRDVNSPLDSLPVSTFPSAHICWAVLAGYYLFRSKRTVLAVALLPLLVLSSLGTVMLAEHYFVDIPAGVASAILAILLVQKIVQQEPERTTVVATTHQR